MTATLQKRYRYEVWRNGSFISTLTNVTSEFTIAQDINTAGAGLTIEVSDTADRQREAPEALLTESGEEITTELGETLTTERTPDVMGNNNSLALYRTNNTIKVYEISTYYPLGKLVYSGFISKWRVPLGTGTDKIVLSCLSDGQELDNYLVQGTGNLTLDVSQAQQDISWLTHDDGYYTSGALLSRVYQEFKPSAGVTNLAAVSFWLTAYDPNNGQWATLLVWSSANGYTTPIATVSRYITSTVSAEYQFILPTPITVNPGDTYEIGIYPGQSTSASDGGGGVYVGYKTAGDVYANGRMFYRTYNPTAGPIEVVGADLYFKTYYSTAATNAAFPTQDPTTMLRTIIDNYVSRGGTVNYASGTTVLTSTTLSYTFKLNTILEGLQKILDMAPHDWYWYVDPATATLYFKQASTTADHTFIFGRHYQSLEIEASVEQMVNDAYFTGGDTGGNVNLFTHLADADAQATNNGRIGLARLTDNRVVLLNTGQVILQNNIDENNSEIYRGSMIIPDGVYDTETIKLGQMIGLAGNGSLLDTLLLQVVNREKHENYVKLTLGRLPPRQLAAFTEAERQLNEAQNQYNPSTPS